MLPHTRCLFVRTRLGARCGYGHVQGPLLPTNVLVGFAKGKVRLPPALFEELDGELAALLLVAAVYGSDQGQGALVDERLQVYVVDGGEGEVEQVAGEGGDGGEVAVEEYRVQDCYVQHQPWVADKVAERPRPRKAAERGATRYQGEDN